MDYPEIQFDLDEGPARATLFRRFSRKNTTPRPPERQRTRSVGIGLPIMTSTLDDQHLTPVREIHVFHAVKSTHTSWFSSSKL